MAKPVFIRLAEVINKKQEKRVMSVTVKPTVTNCSGTIWFTDLMLQEGPALTGYVPHTESRLAKGDKVWFNGVVRSAETVIVCNLGETSGGLDIHIYPKSDMAQDRFPCTRVLVVSGWFFPMHSKPKMTWRSLLRCGNAPETASPSRRRVFISTVPPGTPSTGSTWKLESLQGCFLNYSK